MGFKATEAVEPLDYDFNPHVDAVGTTPEPSDIEANRFLRRWQAIVRDIVRLAIKESEAVDPTELEAKLPQTIGEALNAMAAMQTDEQVEQVGVAMSEIVAEVCQNQPSREELIKLPMRVRAAYIGWLVGQLTSPEKETAGSSTTLLRAV